MSRRLVDLSHVVAHGLETDPGRPAPTQCISGTDRAGTPLDRVAG